MSTLKKYVGGRFIDMTEEEIAEIQAYENSNEYKMQRIDELKHELYQTDYKAIKHFEGWISDEEYEPIKVERQAIREEINRLAEEIGNADL